MKKVLSFGGLSLLLAAGSGWLAGCESGAPTLGSFVAAPLASNVVSNFGEASLKVNPTLVNSSQGATFLDTSYGFTTDTMQLSPPPSGVPGDNSPYVLHLFGTYTDYGNGGYPAFQLEAHPRGGQAYYDASAFSGISFNWYCPTPPYGKDNSSQRLFCLVTARTAPVTKDGDGTCVSGAVTCYDYLGFTIPPTANSWQDLSEDFSSMVVQYGPASSVTPNDLKQIICLMWTNRSNNVDPNGAAGTPYTCDMWLDNIRFY